MNKRKYKVMKDETLNMRVGIGRGSSPADPHTPPSISSSNSITNIIYKGLNTPNFSIEGSSFPPDTGLGTTLEPGPVLKKVTQVTILRHLNNGMSKKVTQVTVSDKKCNMIGYFLTDIGIVDDMRPGI